MAATSATRGRPRGFDRDAALDRAIKLFWRKGYEATSVRDLGEELGIGAPSLYAAFGGKRALFEEAVTSYERGYGGFIDAALTDEPTAFRALHRILTEAPGRYTRRGLPRGCLIVSGDAGTDDREVRAWMSNFRKALPRDLKRKIESDVAAGTVAPATDAAGLAAYVAAVLLGLAQRARDGAPRRELNATARIAIAALSAELDEEIAEPVIGQQLFAVRRPRQS